MGSHCFVYIGRLTKADAFVVPTPLQFGKKVCFKICELIGKIVYKIKYHAIFHTVVVA